MKINNILEAERIFNFKNKEFQKAKYTIENIFNYKPKINSYL